VLDGGGGAPIAAGGGAAARNVPLGGAAPATCGGTATGPDVAASMRMGAPHTVQSGVGGIPPARS
jgi:hypothetical protein